MRGADLELFFSVGFVTFDKVDSAELAIAEVRKTECFLNNYSRFPH